MSNRQLRRAAERAAAKKARKEARKAGQENTAEQPPVATQTAAAGSTSEFSTAPVISASLNRNQDDAVSERARYRASEDYFAETETLKRRIARKWEAEARREQSDPRQAPEPEPESTEPGPLEFGTEPTSANARAGMGGPRTPQGRAQSSLNSLKHGLTGSFRIVGNEHQDEFDSVVAAYTEEHQPATPTELSLIEKMAEHQWLSRRAQRLQDFALTQDELPRLNLYIRYQTTNERAFYKAFSEFKKLKKERLAAENKEDQFVSQKQAQQKEEWQAARVRLANARARHLEVDAQIRKNLNIPTHDGLSVPFQEAKELFTQCLMDQARRISNPKAA